MEKKVINLDKLSPAQLEAEDLLSQASLLISAEQYDEAMEVLQEAEKKNPAEIDIYLRQAQVYIIREDFAAAKEQLDKAEYLDRHDGRIALHRGNVFLLEDDFDHAIEQYAKAEENGMTELADMYMNMGFCYERQNKPSQAVLSYGKAIRLDPENPTYRYRRISLLMENGELDAADEMVTDFIKRFPNIKEGYIMAVDLLFHKDEFKKAEKLLVDVMRDQGEDDALNSLLMRSYLLQERFDEAIALGNRLLEKPDVDPDAAKDVKSMLPRVYMVHGELDKGLKLLQQYVAEEKDGEYNLEARTLLLTVLSSQKRFKELLPVTEDILSKPDLAERLYMAYMLKGIALKELGREEEAREANRTAVNRLRVISIRNPVAVDAHVYRAMCHRDLGEYDEALSELKVLERLGVSNAQFFALRSTVYSMMGKKELADADLEKAKSMKEE